MKYFYNYSYLNKWMEANRDITNKQVMRAMGTTSNTCLDSWVRMKSPLPTIALLRFCNAFHVPLSAFIVDADAKPMGDGDCCGTEYVRPDISDQFEPDGGYLGNDAKRQMGTRALRDPLDVDRIKSVVPGLIGNRIAGNGKEKPRCEGTEEEGKNKQGAATASAPIVETASEPTAETGISIDTLNRMLDIIAEQQKQICDQQKLITELTRRIGPQQAGYGMVAEDILHREP